MVASVPPLRQIKRLLVVNRGEIAVRILYAARELPIPIETVALYTSDDRTHCDLGHPHRAILVPSSAAYTDTTYLVQLAQDNAIDAVHPGYGFLSENADFARRMWDEAGIIVIGPGWETLAQTGDKLQAKQLAERCGVPVLKAMDQPSADLTEITTFATGVGYPVMIKAVDGGGGRGIRLVQNSEELPNAVNRAIGESPSRSVFVEKAAIGGYHHIEIQVVGDGAGQVRHLWERDCSIQRRFQKVVEFAPALATDRGLIRKVIDAALAMARAINYRSLGTFEFLVNDKQSEFYFLEVNPRLQVEHTITESIAGTDLVQVQLLLAQGYSFQDLGLHGHPTATDPSGRFSIQLRLCAEDPSLNFALSIGTLTDFSIPGGHGVRVDSHISSSIRVGADFDNLLAKIIVTASTWEAAVRKAQRVLVDSRITGVKTNLDLLRGIVAEKAFLVGDIDTQWLQANLDRVLTAGTDISATLVNQGSSGFSFQQTLPSNTSNGSSLVFRKGDTWSINLNPIGEDSKSKDSASKTMPHYLRLSRILRNEFPAAMSAEVEYTAPQSSPVPYRLLVESVRSGSALTTPSHRTGDPTNPRHIILPIPGKLTEILVTEGDEIQENQIVAFVKQMKMELEVRSPRAGKAKWVFELEEDEEDKGVDAAEGMLLVELEDETHSGRDTKAVRARGKL